MKKTLYYILISFLLISCEYEPTGNYFTELTPPEDFITMEILLNNTDPSDTIYICRNTRILIKVQAENKNLRYATVLLNDLEDYFLFSNPFDFVLYPDEIGEGVHKLTVKAVFASGSGSLAEAMGMEGYMGEMSWNIRVIPNPGNHFTAGYRLNEDGFLEIYWDNGIPESAIEKYTIRQRRKKF